MTESMYKAAGLGRRLWAIFLDNLGAYLIASAIEPHNRSNRLLLQFGILFIEIAVMTSLSGASFGQTVAHLRVIDYRDGSRLSIPRVLLRTLMILLVLPAIFTSKGRSVHDILCNSIVVRYYTRIS